MALSCFFPENDVNNDSFMDIIRVILLIFFSAAASFAIQMYLQIIFVVIKRCIFVHISR